VGEKGRKPAIESLLKKVVRRPEAMRLADTETSIDPGNEKQNRPTFFPLTKPAKEGEGAIPI